MSEPELIMIGAPIIRAVNFALWVAVAARILKHDRPVPRLVRQLITTVVVFGMGVLFFGSLVPFGIPGEWASRIYTAFTVYAGLIAIGILQEVDMTNHPGD